VDALATSDAGKQKLDRNAALTLARSMDRVIAARGRRVTELDIAQAPSDDDLAALLLGPTGNLRAPAIRRGRVLLVGFSEHAYRQFLKTRSERDQKP
jgi:arsenate reductase-like glutaredoxin family protein